MFLVFELPWVMNQSAAENRTLIVEDVTKHVNYIACDSSARSEIVGTNGKRWQISWCSRFTSHRVGRL